MLSRRQFTGLAAGAVAGSFVSTTTQAIATGDGDPVQFASTYRSRLPIRCGAARVAGVRGARRRDRRRHRRRPGRGRRGVARRGIANKLGDILGGVRDFPLGDGGGVVLVPPGTYQLQPGRSTSTTRCGSSGTARGGRGSSSSENHGPGTPAAPLAMCSRSGGDRSVVRSCTPTTTPSAPG